MQWAFLIPFSISFIHESVRLECNEFICMYLLFVANDSHVDLIWNKCINFSLELALKLGLGGRMVQSDPFLTDVEAG